jgi:YidC/Oxa1 family membrane protein insertase
MMLSSLVQLASNSGGFCPPCGEAWHPIWYAWWQVFGVPMRAILSWLVHGLAGNGLAEAIGPFGIAIILLTITIKLVLSPLFQYQISTSVRVQAEQRRIAPQMAALRKKYKKDPQALNKATMELYREHGINPLSQMSGCFPALVQAPILIALYWVIFGAQKSLHLPGADLHFLWIPDLTARAGLPAGLFILPLLAAATTFVQTKMMTPAGGAAAGQDPTQAAMARNMTLIMPFFIGFISLQFPAALALYWVVSNLFSIGQQYFITGWGSLTLPPVFGSKGDSNGEQRRSERADGRRGDRESARGA